MSSAKELKKKIKTTTNTKKITRTMEMVATARSKAAQNRVQASAPYSSKLAEILRGLAAAGTVAHRFLEPAAKVERSVLVVVTGNRGLCGGYNSNVLGMAERWLSSESKAGRQVDLHVIGKKGISRCKFLKVAVAKAYTHIENRPSFQDADELAQSYMAQYLSGEVQRVVVVSTRYLSASAQKPVESQLLPIPVAAAEGGAPKATEFIFEPDRQTILDALLPLSVSQAFFSLLLQAAVSEQIARRVAMKLATDNAEEMIRSYTRAYNRQRQAGITQQITEVVTGAQALE
jgi:F-type H+-transporting ATPase subunit gamma